MLKDCKNMDNENNNLTTVEDDLVINKEHNERMRVYAELPEPFIFIDIEAKLLALDMLKSELEQIPKNLRDAFNLNKQWNTKRTFGI